MPATQDFLAVDLGASSGRVQLGRWDGARFSLQELRRFPNGPVELPTGLHWEALHLWHEIKYGLARYAVSFNGTPAGIGVDTWGVDYALLDRRGDLLGNPYHYRDRRSDGMMEQLFERVSRDWIYQRTGVQFMQVNTLFQLYSQVLANDPQLQAADCLLMMPDLFHYWLTGQKSAEYTIATTSQLVNASTPEWDSQLFERVGLRAELFQPLMQPGSIVGDLRAEVCSETGLPEGVPVIAPASHDTASAVAAIPDLDRKSAYISSGTWSLVGVELPQPLVTQETLDGNFTNEGGVGGTIRLLKNVAGLWLLQESRRYWQSQGQDYTWEQLIQLAEGAEPFRSLVNPDAPEFLHPGDLPARLREFCQASGQPVPQSPGEVARACLESLALKYRWVFASLEGLLGYPLETIRVVGGGSANRLLCQLTADACRRPVVAGPVEATALGNVMVQAITAGCLSGIKEGRQAIAASVEREVYTPGSGDEWEAAYERFDQLK